jgi:serine/threonine protein phosphatase 1
MSTGRNGMMWWRDLDLPTRRATLEAFSKMPLAIEFMTARGKVGIVHADIPECWHWDRFATALENYNNSAIGWALWNRYRNENDDQSGVAGIGRIFVGHSPQPSGPRRLGNIFNIDTGAVFGVLAGNANNGHLTLVEATTPTYVLEKKLIGDYIDVRENVVGDKSAFNDITDSEKIDFSR